MARIFSQSFIGVEWTWSAGDPTPPYSGMQQNGSGSDAYEASILARASYPTNLGGAGGNGIMHELDDGDNQGTHSFRYVHANRSEIWMRFYHKITAGVTITQYTKTLDLDEAADRIIFGIQNNAWGFWQASGSPTFPFTSTFTWADLFGGSGSDGQWHCFEIHLKQGAGNGICEIWFDNVLVGSTTTATLNGSSGFSGGRFYTNQFIGGPGGPYEVHIDEIEVDDALRVGPLGGGGGGVVVVSRPPAATRMIGLVPMGMR